MNVLIHALLTMPLHRVGWNKKTFQLIVLYLLMTGQTLHIVTTSIVFANFYIIFTYTCNVLLIVKKKKKKGKPKNNLATE